MIEQTEAPVGVEINSPVLPLFSRVEEFAKMGLIPPGSQRNRKYREEKVAFTDGVPEWTQWRLFDSQTSGGLMLAVAEEKMEKTLQRLHEKGIDRATVIGKVVKEPAGKILVT